MPSLTASSRKTSPAEKSPAPAKSILAGDLTGDSGTKKWVATIATTTTAKPSQKIHSYERWSTIRPLRTSPAAPPIPKVAEISPIPVATRSLGNSSLMIPKASGKTAPAAPWTARPATSRPMLCDRAAMTEPSANRQSTNTSVRSLPNMSPKRPRIGVAIEAVSR